MIHFFDVPHINTLLCGFIVSVGKGAMAGEGGPMMPEQFVKKKKLHASRDVRGVKSINDYQ